MRQAAEQAPGVPGASLGAGAGGGAGAGAGVSTFFFPHAVVSIAPLTRTITAHIRKLRIINVLLGLECGANVPVVQTSAHHGSPARSDGTRRTRSLLVPRLPPFRPAVARPSDRRRPGAADPRLRLRHRPQPDDAAAVTDAPGASTSPGADSRTRATAASAASPARRPRACPFPAASSTWSPRSTCCTRSRTRSSGRRSMRCIGCCGPEDRS